MAAGPRVQLVLGLSSPACPPRQYVSYQSVHASVAPVLVSQVISQQKATAFFPTVSAPAGVLPQKSGISRTPAVAAAALRMAWASPLSFAPPAAAPGCGSPPVPQPASAGGYGRVVRRATRAVPVEVSVQPSGLPLGPADVQPWIEAAQSFELNTDFDVSKALRNGSKLDLPALMAVMKRESVGKITIQALADKGVLHHMVDYLGIPQMPALIEIGREATADTVRQKVEYLVNEHLLGEEAEDVVLKPTHLSNGKGVVIIGRMKAEEVQPTIDCLVTHVEQHMREQAGEHESVALRTLQPGFLAQPKYQSVVGFKTPMELRVIALWGKVRLALWWWGRGGQPDEFPNRNVWLVRRPVRPGELSEDDGWELIHQHSGTNCGFDRAIELFRKHISAIAATAEALASAVGAPFLRADFFVGSARWGVRLNEVAYGCGVDYRNRTSDCWEARVVDDAPAIAHILQAGMSRCTTRLPPAHFLAPLGVEGTSYESVVLEPLSPSRSRVLSECQLGEDGDMSCQECAVPEDLCRTIPDLSGRSLGGCRTRSFHVSRLREAERVDATPLQPRSASFSSALPGRYAVCPPGGLGARCGPVACAVDLRGAWR